MIALNWLQTKLDRHARERVHGGVAFAVAAMDVLRGDHHGESGSSLSGRPVRVCASSGPPSWGFRFSAKALTPSRKSWVRNEDNRRSITSCSSSSERRPNVTSLPMISLVASQ